MHLLATAQGSLDDEAVAIDLGPATGELTVLSFSDSDLAVAAAAHAAAGGDGPSLRLVRLAALKHPFSVDVFVGRLAGRTKAVLVRLLGGLDYWRYGVDELAAAARRHGFHLAVVPGDERADERLDAASTLPPDDLRRLWRFFAEGGTENVGQALRLLAAGAGWPVVAGEPAAVPPAGPWIPGHRPAPTGAPRALILFYRSLMLAADTAPILALADALAARGLGVTSFHVSSLKDEAAGAVLAAYLVAEPPIFFYL